MSDEASGCEQDTKAIFDASLEVDRRGFLKYFVGQEISPILKSNITACAII